MLSDICVINNGIFWQILRHQLSQSSSLQSLDCTDLSQKVQQLLRENDVRILTT